MIVTKRAYEPAGAADGFRVLIDRLWPRGVSKAKARLVAWEKEIAPSRELREWYGHDPAKWPEFRRRYTRELRAPVAFCLVRPIAGTPIMFVDGRFLLTIQRAAESYAGASFTACCVRSTETVASDQLTFSDPLRRDEHLVTQPPVARVDDHVSNGPGLLIDKQALYVADVTIGRLDVIAHYRSTTAQVGIVILVSRCLSLCISLLCFRLCGMR